MPLTDYKRAVHVLCLLTLKPDNGTDAIHYVAGLDPELRKEFLSLADSHHVLVRGLARITCISRDPELSRWATVAMADEYQRIQSAVKALNTICGELEAALPEWEETVGRSFLSEEGKERYLAVLRDRKRRLFG